MQIKTYTAIHCVSSTLKGLHEIENMSHQIQEKILTPRRQPLMTPSISEIDNKKVHNFCNILKALSIVAFQNMHWRRTGTKYTIFSQF